MFLHYAQLSRVLNDSSTSGRQIVTFDAKSIYRVRILAESRTSGEGKRPLRSAGHRSWQIRQPAAQSKLRELRQRAAPHALCHEPKTILDVLSMF